MNADWRHASPSFGLRNICEIMDGYPSDAIMDSISHVNSDAARLSWIRCSVILAQNLLGDFEFVMSVEIIFTILKRNFR